MNEFYIIVVVALAIVAVVAIAQGRAHMKKKGDNLDIMLGNSGTDPDRDED